MSLVSMRQILDEAAKGGYGVGAFNVNKHGTGTSCPIKRNVGQRPLKERSSPWSVISNV